MKLLPLWILLLLFACNTRSPNIEASPSKGLAVNSSCFDKYADKLDELLTKNEILSVYPTVSALAEYQYSKVGPVDYHICQYEWQSDRSYMMKVGQQEIVVPRPNKIGVGFLRTYNESIKDPLVYFNNAHRTPTKEEMAEYEKMAKKQMDKKGLTEGEQKIGKEITTPFLEKISFTTIDGLGDAAAWDHMESALAILVGRIEFKIFVEISEDVNQNQELAIKLAKIVLAKC